VRGNERGGHRQYASARGMRPDGTESTLSHGDRGFESRFLQRRVLCEPLFNARQTGLDKQQAVHEKLALLACYREGINGRAGGGVPDGLDHGAQVAPRAERGPQPSAASRGGRDETFIGGRVDPTSIILNSPLPRVRADAHALSDGKCGLCFGQAVTGPF